MDAVVPRDMLPANIGRLLYRAAPLDTLIFRKEVGPQPAPAVAAGDYFFGLTGMGTLLIASV